MTQTPILSLTLESLVSAPTEIDITKQNCLSDRQKLLDDFNKKFAVIRIKGKTRVLEDYNLSPNEYLFATFEDFKNFYCNAKYRTLKTNRQGEETEAWEKIAPEWLEWDRRRQYAGGLVFDPSNKHTPDQKNMWNGTAIQPNAAVKPDKWYDHMYNNVCQGDDQLLLYILNYYAHAVQKPYELPHVALVFRGGKGVGKGTSITPLKMIFGDHFYQTQDVNNVLGRFTNITQNKLIIFLNETVWGGYHKMESKLKGLITEYRKDVEGKGIDVYQVDNYSRVIVDSNDTWAVPTSLDERRYCFINIPDHGHKRDNPYFDAITEELENGGAAGLLYDLLRKDISNYNPRDLPENNEQRGIDMAIKSLPPTEKFLFDWLMDNCTLPFQPQFEARIKRADFHAAFLEYCLKMKIHTMMPTKIEFYKQVRNYTRATDIRIDGYDYFRFLSVLELQDYWAQEVVRTPIDWHRHQSGKTLVNQDVLE